MNTILQQDLFADQTRWPKKPYCSDDFESGLKIRSLRSALLKPYIQANPPHMRVWSIYDVDRPGAAIAWESAGLLPPAWAATNRVNAHAHLVWGLSAPVLVDGLGARDAPMRYLAAIEGLMRAKLGADQGFSGLITKNPAHSLWRVLRGPRMSYDLGDLAEYLPDLEKHRPKQGVKFERIGLGRNVHLFDTLRHWAYVEIRKYRNAGLADWNQFASAVHTRGLVLNAELFGVRALDHREVYHLCKSVSKWTWKRGRAAVARSDKKFSELQAWRATNKGLESWAQNILKNDR